MKIVTVALFLVAALFGLGIRFWHTPEPSPTPQEALKMMTIEEYLRKNIGTLSPEPPVLGGTFYITNIETNPDTQTGTVWYEDGHVAFVADFEYAQDTNRGLHITSFYVGR